MLSILTKVWAKEALQRACDASVVVAALFPSVAIHDHVVAHHTTYRHDGEILIIVHDESSLFSYI